MESTEGGGGQEGGGGAGGGTEGEKHLRMVVLLLHQLQTVCECGEVQAGSNEEGN